MQVREIEMERYERVADISLIKEPDHYTRSAALPRQGYSYSGTP